MLAPVTIHTVSDTCHIKILEPTGADFALPLNFHDSSPETGWYGPDVDAVHVDTKNVILRGADRSSNDAKVTLHVDSPSQAIKVQVIRGGHGTANIKADRTNTYVTCRGPGPDNAASGMLQLWP